MFAVCRNQHFEKPHQLYADLGCPRLRALHPISDAAIQAKELEEKKRKGILLLSECHEERWCG